MGRGGGGGGRGLAKSPTAAKPAVAKKPEPKVEAKVSKARGVSKEKAELIKQAREAGFGSYVETYTNKKLRALIAASKEGKALSELRGEVITGKIGRD